jgi:hypothetical protein
MVAQLHASMHRGKVQKEVSGQRHAPAALARERNLVTTVQNLDGVRGLSG